MSDDITILQSRITAIVDDENRLNRERKTSLGVKQARRDSEKRTEAAKLSTLETDKTNQLRNNALKEQKFQEELKKEGEELVNLSREIRNDYITEAKHRESAKQQLQSKVTALETKLKNIEGRRS